MPPPIEPDREIPNAAPDSLDLRLAELSDQLKTAQTEISQIRLDRQEGKKPWWRQTAIIISVIGLLLSSGFSVYTAFDRAQERKADEKKQRANALDARLTDIVALRMEDARQAAALASTNQTAYRTWSSGAVVKRAMLIDAAVATIHDLNNEISPTTALAIGYELIQDGRYLEAEGMVNLGLKAAKASQSPTGALLSVLAEVYMLQGSPLYNTAKGRAIYNEAIESFSNRTDFSALNNKLSIILWWASAEAAIAEAKESSKLIERARQTLAISLLPISVKAPLVALTETTAIQIQQANNKSLYDATRLLGNWRIHDSENKKSSLILAFVPGSQVPTFARDQIEGGVLANRINGTVFITDANRMRLEWNMALVMNRGSPMQMAGYSDVRLRPNGVLDGMDYPFGLPSKPWTARKVQSAK